MGYMDSAAPLPGPGSHSPPVSRPIYQDRYECWTNEVTPAVAGNVARENKSKYKNVQVGPVMSATDVDALLSRKPNAVRNFINSLNEQMRHRLSPVGAVDGGSPLAPVDYEPEFGRELKECNVSVKSRIDIFDKKSPSVARGTRLMPVDFGSTPNSGYSDTGDVSTEGALDCPERALGYSTDRYALGIHGRTPCGVLRPIEGLHTPQRSTPVDNLCLPGILEDSKAGTGTLGLSLLKHSNTPVQYTPMSNTARSRCMRGSDYTPYRWPSDMPSDCSNRATPVYPHSPCAVDASDKLSWTPSVRTSCSYPEVPSTGNIELPLELVNNYGAPDLNIHQNDKLYPLEYDSVNPGAQDIFRVNASGREIDLHSVNVVKAGWTWMYSSRARRWFPKYLVLFYDEPTRYRHLHDKIRDTDADVAVESNFWDIYKIYSNMSNGCSTNSHSGLASTDLDNETNTLSMLSKSCLQYYLHPESAQFRAKPADALVLIPDKATVFLTILNGETHDVEGALRRGEFRELMEVDVTQVPYTRYYAPRHWLASLIARSMGKEPMYLIHLPLLDGYECVFMPLCAAQFSGVKLSFEMERSLSNRVGREYEQWLFAIWEFVLRNGDLHATGQPPHFSHVTSSRIISIIKQWIRRAVSYLASLWNTNKALVDLVVPRRESQSLRLCDLTDTPCREQSSLQSVLIEGCHTESGVGTPEHKIAVSKGFAQWIESRGFDDLSVSMNIYTLTNRSCD
ncbi:30S ribosomal protein S9, putative [Babesia ovis]|uniref:30S ribosomal protein S9, putative n=1 Tax=Babesia ovis TaxID=5869 RepID=A0A9W5WWC7_BABOV|nr:30S ribosomal protein S9, putative [Babesia ovis]